MSTLNRDIVSLRHSDDFPMLRFGRKYPGVWHVMLTRATARCGRVIREDVSIGLDSMPRYGDDGMPLVCAHCVRKGLEYRSIRVGPARS